MKPRSSMPSEPIHTFDRPPVIETILGVQFKRLPTLKNAHLGLFWNELGREAWPNIDEAPLLEPQYERFGDDREWATLGKINFRVSQDPSFRLRIKNQTQSRMIQVQNGRFHYNWLKTEGAEDYPRYSVVRKEFDANLKKFETFLADNDLGELQPDQWEVTYIDHMLQGTVWEKRADWAKLFRAVPALPEKVDFLEPENFLARQIFEIKPAKGRLHVEINHGFTGVDITERKELIRVVLTARGPVKEGVSTLDEGIRLGRKAVVEAFYNLTSEEAHEYWGVSS
ncbi:MAG: hypothetical protein CO113_14770 [Elusimicrobia bacterium CG_4_9_14_3_um_filter_62_55]|nr:MAG: hypothetical protein COR54_00020 [Elusimicrobia bacterium CG22_combo_CG10-13_8_21_14_all_63_91]PJA18401.1 MAG: hypothetical protein COX66_01240 [Elusimicrobia bacterium CG_4_10_14_0_2_um_filter_63_34]PJB24242.1 MAG: hypothetical protein CO113_14770 [Elusimicrobia bacterium CG_4_9_14_3_um_filter_62_55]